MICDFAETYHIYDYKALPLRLAATLAGGLRDDSRCKLKAAGAKADNLIWLLALAVDRLSVLVWQRTEDGAKGINPPPSVTDILMGNEPAKKESQIQSFNSSKEFEEEMYRRRR